MGSLIYSTIGSLDGYIEDRDVFVAPIVVGGGKQALPDNVRVELELQDERRFGNGTVYLRYRMG
jgi:hypothetical protein